MIEFYDQSDNAENRYKPRKQIRFKTSILQSDLCNYSDAYIVVEGTINTTGADNRDIKNRSLVFKNNAPFITCISKINNVLIGNAKDLDVVMSMYNLIDYSKNCRKTTGGLWNYYRDELSDDTNGPNKKVIRSKSFNYKTRITESTYNVDEKSTNAEGNEIDNPALDMPLINCEINLILTWSANCVLTDMTKRNAEENYQAINSPTGSIFKITDTKLYAPVITLSTKDDNKLLEQLKTGFKTTIK